MARRKVEGHCRTGRFDQLTFEHIPPRSAFNDSRVLLSTIDEWMASDRDGRKRGTYQQGGAGGHVLCGRCNNNTGHWYASEHVRWAKSIVPILSHLPASERPGVLGISGCFPLRILKQAVVMFLAEHGEVREAPLGPAEVRPRQAPPVPAAQVRVLHDAAPGADGEDSPVLGSAAGPSAAGAGRGRLRAVRLHGHVRLAATPKHRPHHPLREGWRADALAGVDAALKQGTRKSARELELEAEVEVLRETALNAQVQVTLLQKAMGIKPRPSRPARSRR